jgi:hypothetical protein
MICCYSRLVFLNSRAIPIRSLPRIKVCHQIKLAVALHHATPRFDRNVMTRLDGERHMQLR